MASGGNWVVADRDEEDDDAPKGVRGVTGKAGVSGLPSRGNILF